VIDLLNSTNRFKAIPINSFQFTSNHVLENIIGTLGSTQHRILVDNSHVLSQTDIVIFLMANSSQLNQA